MSVAAEPIRVRVVRDPGGDPPEWVKEAWLGLEFDAVADSRLIPVVSTQTEQPYMLNKAWLVETKDALDALEAAGRSEAADWWRRQKLTSHFGLKIDSCIPSDGSEIVFPELN